MEPIRVVYDGKNFVPTSPVYLKKNQHALVIIVDDAAQGDADPLGALFGIMSPDACVEIEEALKETERVDVDGW